MENTEMFNYTIDFSNISEYATYLGMIEAMHDTIMESMDFPKFYDKNLDALWDCLTSFIGTPAVITIRGVDTFPEEGRDELNEIIQVFEDACKKYSDEYKLIFEDEYRL